jgi:uncharacterized protein (TIGR03067 family)
MIEQALSWRNFMHSQRLAVAVIFFMAIRLIAAEPPKPDAVKKDMDEIQGTWKLVALEADGKQAPAEIVAALKLVFKGNTLTFKPGEPGFTNYKFKLDPTTKPARLDMTHADGTEKGDTAPGIYLLEGNHLKICIGRAGNRPTAFATTAKSGQGLYTLEREKP